MDKGSGKVYIEGDDEQIWNFKKEINGTKYFQCAVKNCNARSKSSQDRYCNGRFVGSGNY